MNTNSNQFREFLFDTGLGFKGPAYTWTNKPYCSGVIHVRLDRVVANSRWCNLYANAYVNHLLRRHSDQGRIETWGFVPSRELMAA
jgi:hypothetical protein